MFSKIIRNLLSTSYAYKWLLLPRSLRYRFKDFYKYINLKVEVESNLSHIQPYIPFTILHYKRLSHIILLTRTMGTHRVIDKTDLPWLPLFTTHFRHLPQRIKNKALRKLLFWIGHILQNPAPPSEIPLPQGKDFPNWFEPSGPLFRSNRLQA